MERQLHLVCIFAFVAAVISFGSGLEFEPLQNGGKHWVFLAAGSGYFMNYRHQADVCHAYQIIHSHGIPDERIVVMMVDDIADNDHNIFKGSIFNQLNGTDVYKGVPKDYTGDTVNPDVFQAIMRGETHKLNGSKALDSGPNDHLFVYFVDHGAPGLIGFGQNFLLARDFMRMIKDMKKNKRFKKMVFFMETCFSGSMWEDLEPEEMENIYAMVSANATQPSYSTYYHDDMKTHLGDVFSCAWLETADTGNLNTQTLQNQFTIAKNRTRRYSQAQQFGDMSIAKMPAAEFMGTKHTNQALPTAPRQSPYHEGMDSDAVKSQDVPLYSLKRQLKAAKTVHETRAIEVEIEKHLKARSDVDNGMQRIVAMVTVNHWQATKALTTSVQITQWDCYEESVMAVKEYCTDIFNIPLDDYAMKKLTVLVSLCEHGNPTDRIIAAIKIVCS